MRLLQLALFAVSAVVAVAEEDDTPKPTKFNGVTVPPLMELTPSNWAEQVNKTQFLMVKHYRYACAATSLTSILANKYVTQPVLPPLHCFRSPLPDLLRILLYDETRPQPGRKREL